MRLEVFSAENGKLGGAYLSLEDIYAQSDVVFLRLLLMRETRHIINEKFIKAMKDGVMLINASRGGLIDTAVATAGLKSGKIAYPGLDVYEEEGVLFFEDLLDTVIQDDIFARPLTFPNVIVTGHQAVRNSYIFWLRPSFKNRIRLDE